MSTFSPRFSTKSRINGSASPTFEVALSSDPGLVKALAHILDVATANMDEDAFPNPEILDTTCASGRYIHGDGCFKVLGEELTSEVMAEVLRGILSFDNVRRGPGQSGDLPRFEDKALPVLRYAYLNEKMTPSAWSTSMVINYDVST